MTGARQRAKATTDPAARGRSRAGSGYRSPSAPSEHAAGNGLLKISELADASGLSSNYVARLERGELGASLFVAMRIAEALENRPVIATWRG